MTDRAQRRDRLTVWIRSPRGGALLAALLTLAVLLPLWMLAVGWYRTELLSAGSTQQVLLVFEAGGLIGMALVAGLVYLSVNRQAAALAGSARAHTRDHPHQSTTGRRPRSAPTDGRGIAPQR